jgi:hypothetical protein
MDSGMIGKIQKAKQYAQERERFHFETFSVTIHGENNSHRATFENGNWQCDCDFFHNRGMCTHTMALEEVLRGMLPS